MDGELLSPELNGTARYVGMGGAMEALGADLSTMGTNPAGIGLFRHSQAKVSFGLVSQSDATSFSGADKTNMSFDQAGIVFSTRTGKKNFINFGFNYTKSRNFDQILSASSRLSGASQNKLTYLKYESGLLGNNPYVNNSGKLVFDAYQYNQLDYLYMNTLMASVDDNNNFSVNYDEADNYAFNRGNTGYIGEYNFNISGNANDRFYWGLTVGISDVHYNSYSEYEETYNNSGAQLLVADDRRITGTGFNIKAGVIIRPVETSPFRIGLSVATPTWYDLKTENTTRLYYTGVLEPGDVSDSYKFNLYTPWKFGLSLGTTIGRELAIGASYEFADYGSTDNRIKDDGYYDDWGYYNESTSSDNNMNRHTQETLKGVSTLKLGLEYKPDPSLAIRFGYNYVSPMYSKDGYKDVSISSPGTYVTSQSDYTNWKSTNRITCGLGYTFDKFSVDLAYQYSMQKGDFNPFADRLSNVASEYDNKADVVKVKNNRHQVLLTLGLTF